MKPLEKLLFDIETDRIAETGDEPGDPIDTAKRKAETLLAQHGIRPPWFDENTTSTVAPVAREYTARFGPIGSHAAADLTVKASIPWDAGVIRLLQSPMRADLAVELVIEQDRADEFAETVPFLALRAGVEPIACLPNASPVFTRLYADDFSGGIEVTVSCVEIDRLSPEQIALVRRSQKNLRDPASLPLYKALVARLEGNA